MKLIVYGYNPFVNEIPQVWHPKEYWIRQKQFALQSGYIYIGPTHKLKNGKVTTLPGYCERFKESKVKPIKLV